MQALLKEIEAVPTLRRFGRAVRIEGSLVEVTGAACSVSLGGQLSLECGKRKRIPCEVVGFRDGGALAMPLGTLDGVTLGARADFNDTPQERTLIAGARSTMAPYDDMAERIRLGAYKNGTNPDVDATIALNPRLEIFLTQEKDERALLTEGYAALDNILGGKGRKQ